MKHPPITSPMKQLCAFALLFLTLTACDNPVSENRRIVMEAPTKDSVLAPIQKPDVNVNENPERAVYITKFNKAFQEFQSAVYNEDAEGVNQFIDQARGLYIIENPGAMPKMTLVKDIRNFQREFQNRSFFTIKEQLQSCQLKEEELPTFNCEGATAGNTGYSKEGCFAADAAEFRKNEIYKYASLPEQEIKNIETTLPFVQRTVVQTSSSYRFHWGFINNAWKVLFIDLRIPCSA